jgi:hypothetical protein
VIVSTTERGSYKRCRRQWMINSRNRWGLTRIVAPGPLALGTLIHDTLGLWLEMHKKHMDLLAQGNPSGAAQFHLPAGGLSALFVQYATKAITEARDVYERQVGAKMDSGELAPLMESVTQGRCMMDNYQERWGQPIPDGFEVISTEQRVMVAVPGTEHQLEWVWDNEAQTCVKRYYDDTRFHYLEGRLDGIIREKKSGRLFVLEHKSYGQRPREDVLFAQDQFLAYHWLLLSIVSDLGYAPENVAGVAYDGLWKRAAPPKTVDGHKGTLHDLFCRRLITRPVQELVEFENELAMELREMAGNPAMTKNRTSDGSCFWGCSDNELCLSMSRGEDVDYKLRSGYKAKASDEEMVSAGVD